MDAVYARPTKLGKPCRLRSAAAAPPRSQEISLATPAVTVIVPTFNRVGYLRQVIASIRAQSFLNLRIAVFDNASDDGTKNFMDTVSMIDERVVYHRHPKNIGAMANFQFGLESVSTDFFSFISDDDLMLEKFLSDAVSVLETDRSLAFAAQRVVRLGPDGQLVGSHPLRQFEAGRQPAGSGAVYLGKVGVPVWTGIVYRTAVTRRLGGIDPSCGIASDVDFTLRHAVHDDCVLLNGIGAIFTSDAPASHREGYLTALKNVPGIERWIEKIGSEYGLDPAHAIELQSILQRRMGKTLRQAAMRGAWRGDSDFVWRTVPILRNLNADKRYRVEIMKYFTRFLQPVAKAVDFVSSSNDRTSRSIGQVAVAKYPDCQPYLDFFNSFRAGTHPLLINP